MELKNLDPALRAKFDACTTPDEILALAQEEGYTLTDEELDQISGGGFWDSPTCPRCGSENLAQSINYPNFICCDCGHEFQA